MRHFVQYHKVADMGPYKAPKEGFLVLTDKASGLSRGDRVWLVAGEGNPIRYSLCCWFVVDNLEHLTVGKFHKRVIGTTGRHFTPFITINEMPWLPELKRTCGNFGFGLQHVTSPHLISALEQVV
jgi:hypothetical protein